MCKTNTNLEAGLDTYAQPLICAAGYDPYFEVSRCVKKNSIAISVCEHDMSSENNQCFRCQRAYGNKNSGLCSPCPKNCQICNGSGDSDCLACNERYTFDGSICRLCDWSKETYESVTNSCQIISQHNFDIWGTSATINSVQLYFKPLLSFADPAVHLENVFNKLWLNNLNTEFYLIRQYSNIPTHRKVSIYMDLMIVDSTYWEYVYIAVDNQYVKYLYPTSVDSIAMSQFIGSSYMDWRVNVTMVAWHSASTMTLNIMGVFIDPTTNIWVRELRVDFFGCFYTCLDCFVDNSPDHCSLCVDGYYLNNFQCKPCSLSCFKCSGTASFCTSCPSGLHFYLNNCVENCPNNFYVDVTNTCISCSLNCNTCASATVCLRCENGFFLSGGLCVACQASCSKCITSASNCLECSSVLLLAQSGSCVASCSPGYYLADRTCLTCPTGCALCTSPIICTSCSPGYLSQNQECKTNCDIGYYKNTLTSCSPCNNKCRACAGDASTCISCPDLFYLENNLCLACKEPCLTCSSSTDCLTCIEPQIELYKKCVNKCPDGHFSFDGHCQLCESPCLKCFGQARNCITCQTGFIYFSNSCLSSCLKGYYIYQNTICCPNECSSCDLVFGKCTSCRSNNFLDTSTYNCRRCSYLCSECFSTPTDCTKCPSGLYLIGNQCVKVCPNEGYFADKINFVCRRCSKHCKLCLNETESGCTKCDDSYALYKGTCVSCGKDNLFGLVEEACVDICGDGKRFSPESVPYLTSYNICDDGNKINGDGCSSDCMVEKDFICFGGNETSPDICRENTSPSASLSKISENQLIVTFSESLKGWDQVDLEQFMKLKSPKMIINTNYTYTLQKGPADYQVTININFITSALGQQMRVVFNRSNIEDEYGNKLRTSQLTLPIDYKVYPRLGSEQFFNITTILLDIFTLTTAALYPISGAYLCQISSFTLENLQRIGHHFLLNSVYQDDIDYAMFSLFKIFNFGFTNFVNLNEKTNSTSANSKMLINGRILEEIKNGKAQGGLSFANDYISTLMNYSDAFHNSEISYLFLFTLVLSMSISLFIGGRMSKKISKVLKFTMIIITNFLITIALYLYYPLTVKSLNNIALFRFTNISEIMMGSFSILIFLMCLFSPLVVFFVTNKDITVLWHPHYYLKFGTLYSLFKLDKKITKNFLALVLTKNLILAIILVTCLKSAIAQNLLSCIFITLYIFLVAKFRPFINIYMNIFVLVSEISEFGMHVILIINSFLIKKHHAKMLSSTSAILHSFYVLVFLCNLFLFFYFLGMKISIRIDWARVKASLKIRFANIFRKKSVIAPLPHSVKNSNQGADENFRKSKSMEDVIDQKPKPILNEFISQRPKGSNSNQNVSQSESIHYLLKSEDSFNQNTEQDISFSDAIKGETERLQEKILLQEDKNLLIKEEKKNSSDQELLDAQKQLLSMAPTRNPKHQELKVDETDIAFFSGYDNS
jgi:cysteine-rich repeat protein